MREYRWSSALIGQCISVLTMKDIRTFLDSFDWQIYSGCHGLVWRSSSSHYCRVFSTGTIPSQIISMMFTSKSSNHVSRCPLVSLGWLRSDVSVSRGDQLHIPLSIGERYRCHFREYPNKRVKRRGRLTVGSDRWTEFWYHHKRWIGLLQCSSSSSQDRLLKDIYLVPSKPIQACARLENQRQLKNNIALVERGYGVKSLLAEKVYSLLEVVPLWPNSSLPKKPVLSEWSSWTMIGRPMIVSWTWSMITVNEAFTFQESSCNIEMGMIRRCVGRRWWFLFRHLILNALEKNRVIGARINIPLNLTYEAMLKAHRAPGSYWL